MEKTEAIILTYTKYGDNKLIVNTLTRGNGRMSFCLTIPTARNRSSALPYCQPLFQNEIEYVDNGKIGSIKKIGKMTPTYTYRTIPFDTAKTTVAMFLAEILSKILSYSEKNEELFNFISTSLHLLDEASYKGTNFHLKFLMQLAKYMGIYPGNRYSEQKPYFDISRSMFIEQSLEVTHTIKPPTSLKFSQILDSDFLACENINMNSSMRTDMLQYIIEYFRYRFDSIQNIKSIDVLKAIFHQQQ